MERVNLGTKRNTKDKKIVEENVRNEGWKVGDNKERGRKKNNGKERNTKEKWRRGRKR